MTSLVANYDSDSDEYADGDAISDEEEFTRPICKYSEEKISCDVKSSSDDSENSDNDVLEESVPLPNPLANQQEITEVNSSNNTIDEASISVFTTSYDRKEKAKISVLEKHVKVTEAPEETMKNDKKICWRYRKGRCPFGNRCKYSHNTDSTKQVKTVPPNDSTDHPMPTMSATFKRGNKNQTRDHRSNNDIDEDSYLANKKRKVRAGISDKLAPSKKAMASLQKLRSVERPWTVSKR